MSLARAVRAGPLAALTTSGVSTMHMDRQRKTARPAISSEELAVLRAVAKGRPIDAIARELQLSERTVRRRTRSVCDRLGVETPIEAVVWAVRHGLV